MNLAQGIPTLVSLIPFLTETGEGHHFIYNKSVQRAAELIGWKHIAAVPKAVEIDNLSPGWIKCLPQRYLKKKNIFSKIKTIYLYAVSIYRFLRKDVIPKSDFPIIFIESFFVLHLLALILALFLIPRNSLSVWLLYRYPPPMLGVLRKRIFFNVLNKVIKQLIRPNMFQLLTDSELIGKSLSRFFNQPVNVMPIPHTDITCYKAYPKRSKEIVCWWPGPPLASKGLSIIERIVMINSEGGSNLRLVAAESSNIVSTPGGIKVHFTKDILMRSEYLKWLSTCDVILLPYDPNSYHERTSGVFVECITAGKIPVVTKGTWMANELEKFDLEELIVSWDNPKIISWLLKVVNDDVIKNKIEKMQNSYLTFHNEKSFANRMKSLFESQFLEG